MILVSLLPLASLPTAHAATCAAGVRVASGDLDGDGLDAGIPFDGLSFTGIDPDEIDLAAGCSPTITVGGIPLVGIDPDEIDVAEVLASGTLYTTREHVLLARQTGTPRAATVKAAGTVTLQLVDLVLSTRVVSTRPWVTASEAEATFRVVGASVRECGIEPVAWPVVDAVLSAIPLASDAHEFYVTSRAGGGGPVDACVWVCECTEDGHDCWEVCP